jgi:signal-transduction protein with cAMP-binding, CBS, and nucleotidyltransferase domain
VSNQRCAVQLISPQTALDELGPEGLQGGSIFGALSSDAIRFLLEHGKVYRVRKDDLIFNCGDPGDSFFVVCKGSVDFFKQHLGEYTYTRTSQFGEEMGFVAMIALHDHAGKAVAREDGMVLEISSSLFRELHDRFPYDFGLMILNLSRDMARVIRKLSDTLVENAIEH